jgi:hypothetical protein
MEAFTRAPLFIAPVPTEAALFRLAPFQPRDESLTAPEFNRMAVHELPGPLDGVGIVIAAERLEVDKVPVEPDGISAVICHPDFPHRRMSANVRCRGGLTIALIK